VIASLRLVHEVSLLHFSGRVETFSRLIINAEGEDSLKRGTFTTEQLKQGYDKALASGFILTVTLVFHPLVEIGANFQSVGYKFTLVLPFRIK